MRAVSVRRIILSQGGRKFLSDLFFKCPVHLLYIVAAHASNRFAVRKTSVGNQLTHGNCIRTGRSLREDSNFLAIYSAFSLQRSIPSILTSPRFAGKILEITFNNVDFPQPFAPMMIVIFPFGIFKFISSMIMRSSYAAQSPFTSIAFIVSKSLLLLPHQVYKIRYTNQRHRNSRRDFDW